jgi:hypothetical protein
MWKTTFWNVKFLQESRSSLQELLKMIRSLGKCWCLKRKHERLPGTSINRQIVAARILLPTILGSQKAGIWAGKHHETPEETLESQVSRVSEPN